MNGIRRSFKSNGVEYELNRNRNANIQKKVKPKNPNYNAYPPAQRKCCTYIWEISTDGRKDKVYVSIDFRKYYDKVALTKYRNDKAINQIKNFELNYKFTSVDPSKNKLNLEYFKIAYIIISNIYNYNRIDQLLQWQSDALLYYHMNYNNQRTFVYSASTSAGKSLVADLIVSKLVLYESKRVFYLLPYISLLNEKSEKLEYLYKGTIVKLQTLNSEVSTKFNPLHDITICTPEKFYHIFNGILETTILKHQSFKSFRNVIGALVIDECHMVNDLYRGYYLEYILSVVSYLNSKVFDANDRIPIILMSATIPDKNIFISWLNAGYYEASVVNSKISKFVMGKERLGKDYNYCLKIRDEESQLKKISLNELIKLKQPSINNSAFIILVSQWLMNNTNSNNDFKLNKICNKKNEVHKIQYDYNPSNLIFVSTRKECESISFEFYEFIEKNKPIFDSKYVEWLDNYKLVYQMQIDSFKSDMKNCFPENYFKLLNYGIFFHNAGLPSKCKHKIENYFRDGVFRFLFCTTTLSVGVNLPCNKVIILLRFIDWKKFNDYCSIIQMCGRSGRLKPKNSKNVFLQYGDNIQDHYTQITVVESQNKSEIQAYGEAYVMCNKYIDSTREIDDFTTKLIKFDFTNSEFDGHYMKETKMFKLIINLIYSGLIDNEINLTAFLKHTYTYFKSNNQDQVMKFSYQIMEKNKIFVDKRVNSIDYYAIFGSNTSIEEIERLKSNYDNLSSKLINTSSFIQFFYYSLNISVDIERLIAPFYKFGYKLTEYFCTESDINSINLIGINLNNIQKYKDIRELKSATSEDYFKNLLILMYSIIINMIVKLESLIVVYKDLSQLISNLEFKTIETIWKQAALYLGSSSHFAIKMGTKSNNNIRISDIFNEIKKKMKEIEVLRSNSIEMYIRFYEIEESNTEVIDLINLTKCMLKPNYLKMILQKKIPLEQLIDSKYINQNVFFLMKYEQYVVKTNKKEVQMLIRKITNHLNRLINVYSEQTRLSTNISYNISLVKSVQQEESLFEENSLGYVKKDMHSSYRIGEYSLKDKQLSSDISRLKVIESTGVEGRSTSNFYKNEIKQENESYFIKGEELSLKKINQILGMSAVDIRHGDQIEDIDLIIGDITEEIDIN